MANKINISFKIEPEASEAFEKLCKDSFTTKSSMLYAFVHTKIKQSEGNKIILSKLKK